MAPETDLSAPSSQGAPVSEGASVPLTRAAVVTRTLRVAILGSRGIPAHYGGFETFAEELSTRMAQHGHEVTVFCERTDGPRRATHRGVKLRRVRTLPLGPLRTLLYDSASLLGAIRGFDAIYMLGYGAAWAFPVARMAGVPLVVNMDGVEWRRSKWSPAARTYLRWMEGHAVRAADVVIADSARIHRHLEERHGPLPHCRTIPYGASPIAEPPSVERLRGLGLTPDTYDLLVCRLEPENHVLEIVRGHAASRTKHELIVVGPIEESGYCRDLRAAAAAAGPGRARLVGGVYDDELLRALRSHARVSIHGHSVGGTNPSLLEALACESPVFAHDNEYNREVLGESASYFGGAEDLKELVVRADRDPLQLRPTPEEARTILEGGYRWSRIVQEYEELFERLSKP